MEALSDCRFQHTRLLGTNTSGKTNPIHDLRYGADILPATADPDYAITGIHHHGSSIVPFTLRCSTCLAPLVKATQEQQLEIEELRSEVQFSQERYDQLYIDYQTLKAQLDALETLVDELLAKGSTPEATTALQLTPILQQNSPNPFRRETNIEYFVPPGYQTASIHLSTVEGKVVRQIELTQSGRSTLHLKTGTFPGGTYQYSLIIDGKLIDTKRMVIVK